MNLNQFSYNKIADQWSAERHTSFVSELISDLASRVSPGGHILDIGCGTGRPIDSYLSEQGFQITGIDFTENLLNQAKALDLSNARFHLCDFFDYQPDQKFDGIIAYDSFFHFPKEKQATIYSRVAHWMHPGAYLLFTHGIKEGEITDSMYGEMFYYSCLNATDVFDLMRDAGLEVIYVHEYYKERDLDRDLVVLGRMR